MLGDNKRSLVRGVAGIVLVVIVAEFLIALRQSLSSAGPAPAAAAAETPPYAPEDAFPSHRFLLPIGLENAGDDRLFVIEQAGRIKTLSIEHPERPATEFVNISGRVKSGGEQGLLGLAFHPRFAENGEVFLHYSSRPDGDTAISRFRLQKNDRARLDETSEEILLTVKQPYTNHNGGQIAFGPDGFLYIGLGDGGSGGDPHRNGQSLKTLLGKILRIDVNGKGEGRPYGIPADNPFAAREAEGIRPEIFAYGLRNPWRFSFDSTTGKLWAGDVGQDRYEEIDIIEKGKNYGWNIMEGKACFKPMQECAKEGLTPPIFEYGRDQGKSVTGGFVYRGKRLPALAGRYIYSDFLSGKIWQLWYDGAEWQNKLVATPKSLISAFGVDRDAELYYLSYADGKIWRLKNM